MSTLALSIASDAAEEFLSNPNNTIPVKDILTIPIPYGGGRKPAQEYQHQVSLLNSEQKPLVKFVLTVSDADMCEDAWADFMNYIIIDDKDINEARNLIVAYMNGMKNQGAPRDVMDFLKSLLTPNEGWATLDDI